MCLYVHSVFIACIRELSTQTAKKHADLAELEHIRTTGLEDVAIDDAKIAGSIPI